MFTSFNLKYPEYEVITPQTNQSFHVRSLNVQEEERLKGSFMSPTKIMEHLNKAIYDVIVKKPDNIKTYEDFLKTVTIKDRDALLYGLYHITYEEVRNYDVRCSSCRKEFPVTIQASSTFNTNNYPGKDILKRSVPVDLPISKGVIANIRQPSLKDELVLHKILSGQPNAKLDIITETMIIKSFEHTPEEGNEIVYDKPGDIVDAYLSLPARDKHAIYNKYKDEFGQYGIELKMKTYCIHCGNEDIVNIDLVDNFFRMVYSLG